MAVRGSDQRHQILFVWNLTFTKKLVDVAYKKCIWNNEGTLKIKQTSLPLFLLRYNLPIYKTQYIIIKHSEKSMYLNTNYQNIKI